MHGHRAAPRASGASSRLLLSGSHPGGGGQPRGRKALALAGSAGLAHCAARHTCTGAGPAADKGTGIRRAARRRRHCNGGPAGRPNTHRSTCGEGLGLRNSCPRFRAAVGAALSCRLSSCRLRRHLHKCRLASCFQAAAGGGGREPCLASAVSQLSLAQNSPYAEVASLRAVC